MSVYKAINAVQAELAKTGILKNRRNTQGAGYQFRGIDDVYNAIAPLLGGILFQWGGSSTPFWVWSITMAVLAGLAFLRIRPTEGAPPQTSPA